MSEHIEENSSRMPENIMDDFPEQSDTVMTLDEAMNAVLNKAASGCSLPEIMVVVANTAMKFHDADSAFFFRYDKGMKIAQCVCEMHRPDFAPICGTEPLFVEEYPRIMQMMIDVLIDLAAKKEFVSFPKLSAYLPKGSREAKRMEQIGLRGVVGAAYNNGQDFIVVANPRENTSRSEFLRMVSYVLTTEVSKHGDIEDKNAFSFGRGELAPNEVYVGLLNGFELRTRYGAVTEKELTSSRGIIFLTLLLYQDNHALSRDVMVERIWRDDDPPQDPDRTLDNIGYRTLKVIKNLFCCGDFLEKDKSRYSIGSGYKVTTELDALSYEIRDIEGLRDDQQRLNQYLTLLEKFSAPVLPRQGHSGIEHIVEKYAEKKESVQNTVLELMCQLGQYNEMRDLIGMMCVERNWDSEMIYWNIKALAGLGKYNIAREQLHEAEDILTNIQKNELQDLFS